MFTFRYFCVALHEKPAAANTFTAASTALPRTSLISSTLYNRRFCKEAGATTASALVLPTTEFEANVTSKVKWLLGKYHEYPFPKDIYNLCFHHKQPTLQNLIKVPLINTHIWASYAHQHPLIQKLH